jgi:hypothetical protein
MTALNTANLRDLVGFWSCLTIVVGFAGAAVSYLSLRAGGSGESSGRTAAKLTAALAVAMLILAFIIAVPVTALGMAYSGPTPENVPIKLYDQHLAALIALAFAVVFAFDTFWLSRRHSGSK